MLEPVFGHCHTQVQGSTRTFVNAVAAHRVADLAEHLAVFYQFVDQHFAVLVMHIVVACPVDQEQVPFQAGGVSDR